MARALREKEIAGAALDVFPEEPYQGGLTEFPNLLLTCYMGSYAKRVRGAMETEALRNAMSRLDPA